MDRQFPRADFPHDPDELVRVVLFCKDADGARREIGVTLDQWQRWQRGREAVPRTVFAFLRLWNRRQAPPSWGAFAGLEYDAEHDALRHAMLRHLITWADIASLPELRRQKRLAEAQAETIERLLIERDFYKAQCSREARFGLMVNRLFDQR